MCSIQFFFCFFLYWFVLLSLCTAYIRGINVCGIQRVGYGNYRSFILQEFLYSLWATQCVGTQCVGTQCVGTQCVGTQCVGDGNYRTFYYRTFFLFLLWRSMRHLPHCIQCVYGFVISVYTALSTVCGLRQLPDVFPVYALAVDGLPLRHGYYGPLFPQARQTQVQKDKLNENKNKNFKLK